MAILGLADWSRMPYPGLRAFGPEEMEIFFGREDALDAMVDRLADTKFVAVLGPSGCGKSSLVRTGLYSTLTLGLLPNAGGRWRIAEFKPGRQPIRNLAEALVSATRREEPAAEAGGDDAMIDLVSAHLDRGPRSVVELVNGGLLGEETGWNLLIVVDQFEELFRFRDYAGREKAEAVAELLLESARSALPIHVVITMRSEYLGACSLIPGLAEQISAGMYLTPRMTRMECREAIEGPARVRGFDIEPALVSRILNDLQSFAPFDRQDGIDQAEQLSLQADQLPLMQHVLNRMWRHAQGEHRAEAGRLAIRLADYDAVGGLTGALDAHGDDILRELKAELGPGAVETVERVFRALVDGPSLPLAVRRPRPVGELVEAAGGEAKRREVEAVVEAFRGPACNFLRTSDSELSDGVLVDLGHESLIRRWSLLSGWFEAEVEAGATWRRLAHDSAMWERGEGSLLRDLGLKRFAEWWARERPNPYLASRYGGSFDQAERFLAASHSEEARRARNEKRWRYGLRGGAVVVIVALIVLVKVVSGMKDRALAAAAEAQRHEEIAVSEMAKAREATNAATALNLALRDYFGRRGDCRRFVGSSPEFESCVSAGIELLHSEYWAGADSRRVSGAGGITPGAAPH